MLRERILLPLLLMATLVLAIPAHAAPAPSFNGNYELAGKRTDRVFSLEVKQSGKRATINFSASMADGSGAAPDADGSGKIEDGVLSFKFKDTFENEGTCKLQYQSSTNVYQLDMVVTKVVESRPLHFYGTLLLRKIPEQPTTP
jgi:hypothetical protein